VEEAAEDLVVAVVGEEVVVATIVKMTMGLQIV